MYLAAIEKLSSKVDTLALKADVDEMKSAVLAKTMVIISAAVGPLEMKFPGCRHASLSRHKKMEIYNALILSKLLYGLTTVRLNISERIRLHGLRCRCLHRIWNIKPAFMSRISNKEVLTTKRR